MLIANLSVGRCLDILLTDEPLIHGISESSRRSVVSAKNSTSEGYRLPPFTGVFFYHEFVRYLEFSLRDRFDPDMYLNQGRFLSRGGRYPLPVRLIPCSGKSKRGHFEITPKGCVTTELLRENQPFDSQPLLPHMPPSKYEDQEHALNVWVLAEFDDQHLAVYLVVPSAARSDTSTLMPVDAEQIYYLDLTASEAYIEERPEAVKTEVPAIEEKEDKAL